MTHPHDNDPYHYNSPNNPPFPPAPGSIPPPYYQQDNQSANFPPPYNPNPAMYPMNNPPYYNGFPPVITNNRKAIVAFVLSILSFLCLSIVGSIPAVILGYMARKEIARNPYEKGDGFALTAIILGSISIVCFILYVMYMLYSVATTSSPA